MESYPMKKLFLLAVITFTAILSNCLNAEWIPLKKGTLTKTSPQVTLIQDDANSTTIRISISGFEKSIFANGTENFHTIDLLSDVFVNTIGEPALPYITQILAIPDLADAEVEIIEQGETFIFKDINIAPARESWYEGQPETPFEKNTALYASDNMYPQEIADMEDPVIFRDFRISRLVVYPLTYIPSKKELHAISSITVRIKYNNKSTNLINPKTTAKKKIAPSFANIYKTSIFNYSSVLKREYDNLENGKEVMLCIMPDNFYQSFQEYAQWKRQSGIDIHITKFSDIGANSSNYEIIKNHITDAYNNWTDPPTYVLLVGDDGVFPVKIVNYDYSFASENYFAEIEGIDFLPDVFIGRFSNETDYRLQVMVKKFINYEKEPYIANNQWFKKGICCSNNAYTSQIETKRFTARVMREDGGFYSVDTLMSDGYGYNCSMDLDDVKAAINDGRSYLNYRGEGWSTGWWAECYPFQTSDVTTLNNGEMLTFVTSIGCGVAMFNASGGNCFGESWVKLGTLTEFRGAPAFIGPTSNTHTTYNNRIDKGIYVGMFREGMQTPGEALVRGKFYMYYVFGATDPWVEYHYRIFCVLGDPSIHIWKDVPQQVSVQHPANLPIGHIPQHISVTNANTGDPISNAQVTIIGQNVFASAFTDSTGVASVDLTTDLAETLTITVRGGNVIPYQGSILVMQDEVFIGIQDFTVNDIDGNQDGLMNPNENGNISFVLKNWGTQSSANVQGTLTITNTTNAEVITAEPIDFGIIEPSGLSQEKDFQFFVHSDCPVGQNINFHLHLASQDLNWDYDVTELVKGYNLNYQNHIAVDNTSGNANFRLDPDETSHLWVNVLNNGEDIAENVHAILRSNNPYITILDSMAGFGTINIGDTKMNNNDDFVIEINANCPTNYTLPCYMELYTENTNYNYSKIVEFNLVVGMPSHGDFSGPDAYGYYAYSNDDIYFDQTPTYNWIEIDEEGTEIIIPNGISDYTQTVNLPFTFKYYGIDYDQIRISTDGWAALGSGNEVNSTNFILPLNDNVNNMVAPLWDDFYDVGDDESGLYYHYSEANNAFVLEWDNLGHNGNVTSTETFQILLLDPSVYQTASGDGEIVMQYKDISNISSATIGLENAEENIGLLYYFNGSHDSTAPAPITGLAVKFTTEQPSVTISIDEKSHEFANSFALNCYPNPFKTETSILFTLAEAGLTELKIYNLNGEAIRNQVLGNLPTGKHEIKWNGTADDGTKLPTGLYLIKLIGPDFVSTQKLFFIK